MKTILTAFLCAFALTTFSQQRVDLTEIAFRNADGGDDSDPYRLRKVRTTFNVNWLELQLNDDADESFRIYGNSCNGFNCGEYSNNLYHLFDASGNAFHSGKLDVTGKGKFGNNLKVFGSDEPWAEGISVVKPSGWSGIRFSRNDPATGNYEGNWALGYASGNDFSISTNYNGNQYDGIFHISNNTRNVGIGTLIPAAPFHVKSSGVTSHFAIETNANGEGDLQWFQGGMASINQRAALQVNSYSGDFEGWTFDNANWNKWLFVNRTNSYVGIGTSTPDHKLTVNGTIHSTEVKVTTTVPGPDYVFEKDYHLPSLDQIKSYIDQNKHLPEVPSAKEMEANGVNLGEMNMLLLRKIEELTLYAIEQDKKIEMLEKRSISPDTSGKKVEELMLLLIKMNNENIEQNKLLTQQHDEIEALKKLTPKKK